MARIICDTYIKKDKQIFGEDPTTPFNQQILAANAMYGWLYDNGILENASFIFKDYKDATHFALNVDALMPYRKQMEESGLSNAQYAVHLLFDQDCRPCTYSGAIQFGWSMSSYRSVDGMVGRSWECDLIKALDTTGIYEVAEEREVNGITAAVHKLFAQFDWNPTLSEQKASLSSKITDATQKSNTESVQISKNIPER